MATEIIRWEGSIPLLGAINSPTQSFDMKASNCTESELREALRLTLPSAPSLEFTDFRPSGNGFRFRLKVDSHSQEARRSHRGRRMPCANWRTHYNFMLELYRLNDSAKVETALATYTYLWDFLNKAPQTVGKIA